MNQRKINNYYSLINNIFDRSGRTKSPLSEKADSEGTEDPLHIRVSRAKRARLGNRLEPEARHQSIGSRKESSNLV